MLRPISDGATCIATTENLEKAIADYDEAIRLKPRDAQAHYHRGLAYYRSGDDVRAIADYDAAIHLDPAYSAAYDGRGNAHDRQGDPARAKADHEQAARLRDGRGA